MIPVIPTKDFDRAEEWVQAIIEPLAPLMCCRRFVIDYKTMDGRDKNTDIVACCPRQMNDEQVVEKLKERLLEWGKVSSIFEQGADGMRCLYVIPGYLEESISEIGLHVPGDMENAVRTTFGSHLPVNWDELVRHWRRLR
ncbi:hypothetical protein [uncultured Agathobaculum sp.]|uniref:hypothetical protein n=1 Tax=uncultured Agathobaculum sp. TaxID=2048140 RepID=UPI003208BF0A